MHNGALLLWDKAAFRTCVLFQFFQMFTTRTSLPDRFFFRELFLFEHEPVTKRCRNRLIQVRINHVAGVIQYNAVSFSFIRTYSAPIIWWNSICDRSPRHNDARGIGRVEASCRLPTDDMPTYRPVSNPLIASKQVVESSYASICAN